MIDLANLIRSVGVSAITGGVISALIIFLARFSITERIRGLIKAEYDQKLETLKAQLKADSDVRLLEQTHSLQMAAKEHELRFGTLNEKRANILAEIYEALYDTFRGIRILTASMDFDDESETKKKVD